MKNTTRYYQLPGGSFTASECSGFEERQAPVPDGAVEINAQEYETGVAALEAARAQWAADQRAAEAAAACEDYEALIAAGVPEATARRMSGCTAVEVESNGS
ncbi:hypothetical protein [Streptomyces anulatus]|uniref:hypothetical protein n=1 Tax=Streptomyces anulatus TaxID=1892 RepID=UPI003689B4FB